jgi:hypothetical protein
MEVGDLVRLRDTDLFLGNKKTINSYETGIILEIRHTRATQPDYRTPTSVLVYFPDNETEWNKRWHHTQELKLIIKNESR